MSTNWKILYATTENPASVGETFNANATEENLDGESSVNTELEAKANAERIFDGISEHPTRKRLVTAEAVRKGHPDKCCDQIADNILDEILRQDPNGRAAIEVMISRGKVLIAGEIAANASVDYCAVIADTFSSIGYDWSDVCGDDNETLNIETKVSKQSPDIAQAVLNKNLKSGIGAGDQGIVVGYATDESRSFMPCPLVIAQNIFRYIDEHYRNDPRIGKDGKALVTMVYKDNVPVKVHTIVISMQHAEHTSMETLRGIAEEAVKASVPEEYRIGKYRLIVNPSGKFVKGGPVADTGLTGRKLAVDQYGPVAHIGGGALSGKDATKVDRSGAYLARWIAKNLVCSKLCRQCEVTLTYVIGQEKPMTVTVNSFGTAVVFDKTLAELVSRVFDLRISSVIEHLQLKKPIYAPLAAYGHFGRSELNLPWENCDMVEKIRDTMLKMIPAEGATCGGGGACGKG